MNARNVFSCLEIVEDIGRQESPFRHAKIAFGIIVAQSFKMLLLKEINRLAARIRHGSTYALVFRAFRQQLTMALRIGFNVYTPPTCLIKCVSIIAASWMRRADVDKKALHPSGKQPAQDDIFMVGAIGNKRQRFSLPRLSLIGLWLFSLYRF